MLVLKRLKKNNLYQAGFTVVEVGVIIPIILVVIGAFILTIINFTGRAVNTRENNTPAVETQSALNRIADDVSGSFKFLAQNEFPLQSPQGKSDNTANFTNNDNTVLLILQAPFTSANPRTAPANQNIFVYKPNSPAACNSGSVSSNSLATYNLVYFRNNNGNIYRRLLVPANYTSGSNVCSTPWQKPTCTAGKTGTYCSGGKDELLGNFSSFSVSYFHKATPIPNDDTITNTNVNTRQDALNKATSIKVKLSKTTAPPTEGAPPLNYTAERILPLE